MNIGLDLSRRNDKSMIKSFPKIHTFGKRHVTNIWQHDLEITEKVDGSQIAWGRVDGRLYIRSKGVQIFPEKCDNLFIGAVNHILNKEDKLPEDIVFYAENLQTKHHNVLDYGRIPKNHLALFGASDKYGNFFSDYRKWADILDIDVVPVLFSGKVENISQLIQFLETDSFLGNTKIEGFVAKAYGVEYILGGVIIDIMCAKYVSEKFKEKHDAKIKSNNPGLLFEEFKESFCTEARWRKSIQHLRDDGLLENDPRDIGKLIRAINEDIVEEELEGIKNWLWNHFRKDILRKSTAGFPEFYKSYLLEKSFEE